MRLRLAFLLSTYLGTRILAHSVLKHSDLVVHESVVSPGGFVRVGAAAPDLRLNLRLGLVSADFATLEQRLYEVSTPSSTKYGQHLSTDEVKSYMTPAPGSLAAVTQWLAANNVSTQPVPGYGDWLGIQPTVQEASVLFAANFSVYKHVGTGVTQVRTLQYSIPKSLKEHLEVVHPLVGFATPRAQRSTLYSRIKQSAAMTPSPRVDSSCSSLVTPVCLQGLYGLPSGKPNATGKTSFTVTGYLDEYAQQSDLKSFLQQYRPDLPANSTFTLQTIDGGVNPQGPNEGGFEANLDIELTVGLVNGIPVRFLSSQARWNQSDGATHDSLLDTINFIAGETTKPSVVTTSYDSNENVGSRAASIKVCNAFAALGAEGVSMLYSSGDGGVGGIETNNTCTTFIPTFPSTCPYITSVGATIEISPEQGAVFSSGGFSNYFATPSYQASAVKAYVAGLNGQYNGLYNASGRGFPDISAQGQPIAVVNNSVAEDAYGTSCSTPIWASTIALLNDQLIHAGKSPLGFLNPWLYSTAATAVNDIASGGFNVGCGVEGFSPAKGWDPITGLRTPNFAKLRKAAGLS